MSEVSAGRSESTLEGGKLFSDHGEEDYNAQEAANSENEHHDQ